MRRFNPTILLPLLLALTASFYAPPGRADDAVAELAGIAASLQHFPSAADKEKLAAIAASDAGASVKAVAAAISNLQHKVSDADRVVLEAIAADDTEPAALRELAAIVARINHVPSAEDKAALEALAMPQT